MYKTINFSTFCDEFKRAGRSDSWSLDGLRLLYDYIGDEDIELDVIALDSEWCEFATLEEVEDDLDNCIILSGDDCIVVRSD